MDYFGGGVKGVLARVCHDRAIGGEEELEKEGTRV